MNDVSIFVNRMSTLDPHRDPEMKWNEQKQKRHNPSRLLQSANFGNRDNENDKTVDQSYFEGGQKENADYEYNSSNKDSSESSDEEAFADLDATDIQERVESETKEFEVNDVQERELDKTDQIKYFFKIMVEHNAKVLETAKENVLYSKSKKTKDHQTEKVTKKQMKEEAEQKIGMAKKLENIKSEIRRQSIHENAAERKKREREDKTQRNKDFDHRHDLHDTVESLMFEDICGNVNQEEERLQLWMSMSLSQKLDMLAHQVIEQEA